MASIGVIGAGAWGTALAQMMARGGRDAMIWAREPEVVESINNAHENSLFLKGVKLHESLRASADPIEVASRDVILMVAPAQHTRSVAGQIRDVAADRPVVICSKGIELQSGLMLSQVLEEAMPAARLAVLSGPNFAGELARGLPGAATLAAKDEALRSTLQSVLGVPGFRPYGSDDLIGAQLGGAVKNVIAIACGIIYGRNMGDSARAALITRGLAEIVRLGAAIGAEKETLLGMCGVGDLMLTCSSIQSRNFSLGAALGQGETLEAIMGARNAVTEGVHTARATLELASKHNVDMPITDAINRCLNEGLSVDSAIDAILSRPVGEELSD